MIAARTQCCIPAGIQHWAMPSVALPKKELKKHSSQQSEGLGLGSELLPSGHPVLYTGLQRSPQPWRCCPWMLNTRNFLSGCCAHDTSVLYTGPVYNTEELTFNDKKIIFHFPARTGWRRRRAAGRPPPPRAHYWPALCMDCFSCMG